MEINLISKPEIVEEDLSLKYTKEIVSALKEKMKNFNSDSLDKVSFSKLNTLFVEGAKEENEFSLILNGFARVNMFLRLLKNKSFVSEFKADGVHDFYPNTEDFDVSKKDLELFKLNFDIETIDELYLRDLKEVSFLASIV